MINSLGVQFTTTNGQIHIWPLHKYEDFKAIAKDLDLIYFKETIVYGFIDKLQDGRLDFCTALEAKSRARQYKQKFTTKENPYNPELQVEDLEL